LLAGLKVSSPTEETTMDRLRGKVALIAGGELVIDGGYTAR